MEATMSKVKINHFIHMDNIKIFTKINKELETLV